MQMALARRIALNFSARFGDALFRTVPQRLGYSSTPPTIDASRALTLICHRFLILATGSDSYRFKHSWTHEHCKGKRGT